MVVGGPLAGRFHHDAEKFFDAVTRDGVSICATYGMSQHATAVAPSLTTYAFRERFGAAFWVPRNWSEAQLMRELAYGYHPPTVAKW